MRNVHELNDFIYSVEPAQETGVQTRVFRVWLDATAGYNTKIDLGSHNHVMIQAEGKTRICQDQGDSGVLFFKNAGDTLILDGHTQTYIFLKADSTDPVGKFYVNFLVW